MPCTGAACPPSLVRSPASATQGAPETVHTSGASSCSPPTVPSTSPALTTDFLLPVSLTGSHLSIRAASARFAEDFRLVLWGQKASCDLSRTHLFSYVHVENGSLSWR